MEGEKERRKEEEIKIQDEMFFRMNAEDIEALKEKHPSLTTEEIVEAVEYYQDPENHIRVSAIEEMELADAFLKQTVRNAQKLIDKYHEKAAFIFVRDDMADFKELEDDPPALKYEFGDPKFLCKITNNMEAMMGEKDYYDLTKALYECLVQEARERLQNVEELLENCINDEAYPEEEFLIPPHLLECGVAAG